MTFPRPIEPLDDPITEFLRAIDDFVEFKVEEEQQTQQQTTLEDIKRHIQKSYALLVGAKPEIDGRLDRILAIGATVVSLTDDPFIVGPVGDLAGILSEYRADIERATSWMARVTSGWGVFGLGLKLLGYQSRKTSRLQQIAAKKDDLEAYYLMQLPPCDPA
jgi:hypothetical protein